MKTAPTVSTASAAALAALLLLIAACGNKGDLVRPPAEPAKAPAPTSVDDSTNR